MSPFGNFRGSVRPLRCRILPKRIGIQCRPLIHNPLSLKSEYNRDPNVKAPKRRGSTYTPKVCKIIALNPGSGINHGFTLGFFWAVSYHLSQARHEG